jgi:RNA polymerase sigma-70 factor (ECF subfamily)
MALTEGELIEKAREGDREAIGLLVDRYQRMVRAYTGRLAPDPDTADDLAQDAFLAFFRALDRVDPKRGLKNYLMGITRNTVRRAWRKERELAEVSGEMLFERMAAVAAGPAQQDPRLALLRQCMNDLSARMERTVRLFYEEEKSCDEIAGQLRMRAGSVRAVLTRARQALLECVRRKVQREDVQHA